MQHGCVSRDQLRAAGIGSGVIDRLVRSGFLVRIHRAVFIDGALLSHLSAAVMWGLVPVPSGSTLVDVMVIGSAAGRRRGVRIHRTELVHRSDIRVRAGLPVTSPIRTLIDIAPSREPRELERAFDEALVRGLVRLPDLRQRVKLGADRRGLRPIRELMARETGTTFTRSQAEELFLKLVRQAQLPAPQVNARRHGFELDFFWEAQRVAVEIDGFAFHGTRRAFERDRRRDARLQAAGISTMRVTWRQLRDEPLAVIARLAGALAGPTARTAAGSGPAPTA